MNFDTHGQLAMKADQLSHLRESLTFALANNIICVSTVYSPAGLAYSALSGNNAAEQAHRHGQSQHPICLHVQARGAPL